MEDRTKEKNKFFVENENTQRRRKKKGHGTEQKRFSGVKNKNHEQERGKNEENNFKKMKEVRKVIIFSLQK